MSIWHKHHALMRETSSFANTAFNKVHNKYFGKRPYQIATVDVGEEVFNLFYIKFNHKTKIYIRDTQGKNVGFIDIHDGIDCLPYPVRLVEVNMCKTAFDSLYLGHIFTYVPDQYIQNGCYKFTMDFGRKLDLPNLLNFQLMESLVNTLHNESIKVYTSLERV